MNPMRSLNLTVRSWAGALALLALVPVACGDDDDGDTNVGGEGGEGGENASGAGGRVGSGGRGGSSGSGTGGAKGGSTGAAGSNTGGSNSSGSGGEGDIGSGGTATAGTASAGGQGGGGQAGESGGGQGGETAGLGGSGGDGGAGEAGAGGQPQLPLANIVRNGWLTSQYGEFPTQAFDRNHFTKWVAFPGAWLQYEFLTAPPAVASYGLVSGNDVPGRDPRSWVLLGNNTGPDGNEGSDSEWTVIDTRTDQNSFTNRNELHTFDITTPISYKFFRLKVTASNGNAATQLSELELYAAGGANVVQGAHGTDPNGIPYESAGFAFDHDYATKWYTSHPTEWLQYEFRAITHTVESYVIVSGNDQPSRDPRSWVLLGNNTGPDLDDGSDSEWTVLDTQTNQGPFAGRNQPQTYTVANPGAFRFYRLKITESNGAGALQLSEFELLAR